MTKVLKQINIREIFFRYPLFSTQHLEIKFHFLSNLEIKIYFYPTVVIDGTGLCELRPILFFLSFRKVMSYVEQ